MKENDVKSRLLDLLRSNRYMPMRKRGLDPNSYRSAVIFANVTDPLVNEFLRQRIGVTYADIGRV